MKSQATAIIAEDESILRAELKSALAALWPELQIVGEAGDGIMAASLLQECKPDFAILDVRMPGLSGVEVARLATHRAHIIFLTAYNEYAVDAFDQGAVDYLLKPLDMARLALTVQRMKDKLPQAAADLSGMRSEKKVGPLRWIQASHGGQLRFIDINEVLAFRADAKYTKVETAKLEAHIRTTIRDLLLQLDPEQFWQISRSAIVRVSAIDAVKRIDAGLSLRMRDSEEWLPVSQAFQSQFRQM
ncbi:LytTR family DNA-binding domain-containing protein [Undibacterium cyanobacteriorum]|uniref:LytTR family DNA-binding domain-containing protein n=1 Tax=Undibacterium cyanobacteriorum TaxID=3073561 RepID=A0ABY9RH43_9BURK|nr:LytTR family DNA-binding domain-containing protein [Undibacterium sp. 20NA77.5]WMW80179.1 LytTR family DNA-binding domain-containing protein [Undibacterium sp. 20NA77.5]